MDDSLNVSIGELGLPNSELDNVLSPTIQETIPISPLKIKPKTESKKKSAKAKTVKPMPILITDSEDEKATKIVTERGQNKRRATKLAALTPVLPRKKKFVTPKAGQVQEIKPLTNRQYILQAKLISKAESENAALKAREQLHGGQQSGSSSEIPVPGFIENPISPMNVSDIPIDASTPVKSDQSSSSVELGVIRRPHSKIDSSLVNIMDLTIGSNDATMDVEENVLDKFSGVMESSQHSISQIEPMKLSQDIPDTPPLIKQDEKDAVWRDKDGYDMHGQDKDGLDRGGFWQHKDEAQRAIEARTFRTKQEVQRRYKLKRIENKLTVADRKDLSKQPYWVAKGMS